MQAALFSPTRLAPDFPEGMAVKDFRYNAWYGPDKAPQPDAGDYRLQLAGLIANSSPGRSSNCTLCLRSARSPVTSASRAGA